MITPFTVAAQTEVTQEIACRFIREHERHTRPRYDALWRYYAGEHPICGRKKRSVLANNRLVCNHAKYISDTAVGYFAGNPVKYSGDGIEPLLALLRAADSDTQDIDLAQKASIFGVCYEFIYVDEGGTPRLYSPDPCDGCDPRQAFVIYDDTVQQKPVAGVYYYGLHDSRTCECCGALDGKVFDLAKAKAGTNYPPMHPFCRSTTIADFGDEEFSQLERRAKDKDGRTVKVPAGMTYEEWKQGLSGQGGAVQLTLGDLEKSYGGMRYGELTKPHNGGIMNANRFNTTEDPMREVTGSAMSSNPDEVETMKKDLIDSGVELIITDHDMAYAPGILPGEPGQFLIDKNASFSAWCHEYKHFCDDRNDGFLGFRVFEDGPKCRQREIDAYQIEIDMAEKAGRSDIAERLKKLRDMEVAHYE